MYVRPTASARPHHKHFSRLVTYAMSDEWIRMRAGIQERRRAGVLVHDGSRSEIITVLPIPREELTILVRMGGQSVSNFKRERTPWIGVGSHCQLGMLKEKVILLGISLEWTGIDRRAAHSHPSEGQHAAAGDK